MTEWERSPNCCGCARGCDCDGPVFVKIEHGWLSAWTGNIYPTLEAGRAEEDK